MTPARTPNLKDNLQRIEGRISEALAGALRNRSGLTLIAVSKRQPLSKVLNAYKLGLRNFGESQIQEALPKSKAAPEDIVWHFIGHLQKNKVRKAVKAFPYIHSIDSLSLLKRVNDLAGEERVRPKVFLQVNYALDPDRYGLHPDAVEPVLETALAMSNIECVGLMGIPPSNQDNEKTTAYFKGLVASALELKQTFSDWPGKLSLGMSEDFESAIAAGSHYIRLGSALFGSVIDMLVLKEYVFYMLLYTIKTYWFIVIVYCIAGFFVQNRHAAWYVFLQDLVDPPLRFIRKITQNRMMIGMFDLSPIVLFLGLELVMRLLPMVFF